MVITLKITLIYFFVMITNKTIKTKLTNNKVNYKYTFVPTAADVPAKIEIIATEKGGIADVTHGFDIPHGDAVPSNSLLIVPVSDGRGVKITKDAIFMIKGGYKIEK